MSSIRLSHHRRAAWRLVLRPGALAKLQRLFQDHSFWAANRSCAELRQMLRGSDVAVTAWHGSQLVGFGRATSDGIFRAVLWDVVVAREYQGRGLGRQIVAGLLERPCLRRVERVYLMTTNSGGFYQQLGFDQIESQLLMMKQTSG